ncbi:MAG: 30S ribosomal protein S13 [Bacteroidia bacterium]|nr:30S ribosomal protein S13 [Bacteroidia bacterium]MCX7764880.1 30S ribosomal protein S13 [Bacteroidia bacterium]MDW8057197.1 30S ribosomal protein S13 [Bacteroidia bacterium]
MARVAGVDLPRNKPGFIALRYIYGIGRSNAWDVLSQAQVDPRKRVSEWTEEEIGRIRSVIEQGYTVEGQLRAEVQMNIRRLIEIGSYRGMRHKLGLPVRGQRTRTNARTRKGKRKTVAGKKKAPKK